MDSMVTPQIALELWPEIAMTRTMVLPLRFQFSRLLVLAWLLLEAGNAGAAGWDARLAGVFSGHLQEMERELAGLEIQLEGLPGIPVDDQGGTGGFANMQAQAAPARGVRAAVEVCWPVAARVDEVALVPARRYDARGLDAQYGLPDAFTVELIDAGGGVVRCVAREVQTRSHPVRRGHPFVYQVSPPVEASGVRVSADVLQIDSDGSFVHAWAEVFVFDGERNLARGAAVRSLGGVGVAAPWHWNGAFLVDGQTPLGLPEIPSSEHRNIGWISEGRAKASDTASLKVDLGAIVPVDALRLFPAKRPTSDLPSGFGFPRKLRISVSDTGDTAGPGQWTILADWEMPNPGHNPVLLAFKTTRARHVRIEAIELWKAFEAYPAFFALSEVEVLSGNENLVLGKPVRSSDGMLNLMGTGGRLWSSAALSDGFGPDGRLVSTRQWLAQLDRRLQLETRRYELKAEGERWLRGWRRAGFAGFAVLGLLGAFLIVALPIRYRRRARRDLLKVRERIASDLHDEVGSNLGSIQMFADLAGGRTAPSDDLARIQRIAAETVSAVRDIVWMLRPQGDHRIPTIEHLRETSSILLESLEWEFIANEDASHIELAEERTRHLFLFFREALHNILRHARAHKVEIRVETTHGNFQLTIADDGVGIDPDRMARPATLHALRQRAEALHADLGVDSRPGEGTRLTLTVPLDRQRGRRRRLAPVPVNLLMVLVGLN